MYFLGENVLGLILIFHKAFRSRILGIYRHVKVTYCRESIGVIMSHVTLLYLNYQRSFEAMNMKTYIYANKYNIQYADS